LQAFLWVYFFEKTIVEDLGPNWVPDCPWTLIASTSVFILESALVQVRPTHALRLVMLTALLQAFYARRVRVISQKLSLAMIPWALILARVGVATATLTIAGKTSLLLLLLEHRYLIDLSINLSIFVRLCAHERRRELIGALGRLLEHGGSMLVPVAGTKDYVERVRTPVSSACLVTVAKCMR
jgi:hypothetical protein